MRLTRLFSPVRRAHVRSRVELPIDWRVFGSVMHGVSITRDLSPGGAFVRTLAPKPPGTPLVLLLETARGRREVHARVTRVEREGMAVRFTRPL